MNSINRLLVEFKSIRNGTSGEEFILYSDDDMAQNRLMEIRLAHEAKQIRVSMGGVTMDKADQDFKQSVASLDVKYNEWRKDRDGALEKGGDNITEHRYEFRPPDYGDVLAADGDAQKIGGDGEMRRDATAYHLALLRAACKDQAGVSQAILALSPPVASEIIRRIVRAAHPDERRLPFTVWESEAFWPKKVETPQS